MKIVTPQIIDAIHRLKIAYGTNEQVGKVLGITGKHVGQILAGRIHFIRDATWSQMRELLQPFMAEECISESPAPYTAARTVPVFGLANAAGLDAGALYADEPPDGVQSLDTIPVSDPDVIAGFRVVGQSMEPEIRDGDIVLCTRVPRPDDLPSGALVVTKFDDIAVCKRWRRYGDRIILESINPEGAHYDIHAAAVAWVLRIRRIIHEL